MTPPPETAFCFDCQGAELLAILHGTKAPARRGVVIVVGGPQYRLGSHRQFLLIARALAAAGFPVLRFDHRGIGDSDGPHPGFESLEDDIAAAVDVLFARCDGLEEVVLWGLCDAASAILLNAARDARITGIVLLNPWVRTESGEAKTYLKHYYRDRLLQRSFWIKLLKGGLDWRRSLSALTALIRRAGLLSPGKGDDQPQGTLPERMAEGFGRFTGETLLLMSGRDLTAREFDDLIKANATWRTLFANKSIRREDIVEADHTFSQQAWHRKMVEATLGWLRSW